jgi:hypothetical protein
MARYLPNNADTLNPCTLPPRVRLRAQVGCWSPSLTLRARKRKFARRANVFPVSSTNRKRVNPILTSTYTGMDSVALFRYHVRR